MTKDNLLECAGYLVGIAAAFFASVATVHGMDHALRPQVIAAILVISVACIGLNTLTPRKWIKDREAAARVGQVAQMSRLQITALTLGLLAFGLAVVALGWL